MSIHSTSPTEFEGDDVLDVLERNMSTDGIVRVQETGTLLNLIPVLDFAKKLRAQVLHMAQVHHQAYHDGGTWDACPRSFCKDAARALAEDLRIRRGVL